MLLSNSVTYPGRAMTTLRSKVNPLSEAIPVTLDGSGNGTVKLGPLLGQTWELKVAAVRIPNAIKIPQCRIYMGATATDENLVDGTYSGALNSTSRVNAFPLTRGLFVFAVWSNGDANAKGTLSIFGTVAT